MHCSSVICILYCKKFLIPCIPTHISMFWLWQKERETYEVIVEDGKLVYGQTGMLITTTEGSKWIFVLSTSRALYVGQKKKGAFQHSSFLSGGATIAAGRLVATEGVLEVCIARIIT